MSRENLYDIDQDIKIEKKRRAKRIPLEANLAMNRIDGGKGEIVPIQILDVSKSGLGFECARELEMGSVYDIELVLWTKEKINTFITIILFKRSLNTIYKIKNI